MKCPWCDKQFETESSIIRHASRFHKKSHEDYDLLINHNGVIPHCKCGCGEQVKYSQHYFGYNSFIKGHQSSDPEIRKIMIEQGSKTAKDPERRKQNSLERKEWWAKNKDTEKGKLAIKKWLSFLHEGNRKALQDPEYCNYISNLKKELWASDWGNKQREYCSSQEFKNNVSIGTTKALDNDEIRAKMSLNASINQTLGKIGPNKTYRSWHVNPFTGVNEHFDSTWEVLTLNEASARNVPIKRNSDLFIDYVDVDGKRRLCIPDFVTLSGKTMIEVKGRKTETDKIKIMECKKYCSEHNMIFILIDKKTKITSNKTWSIIK